MARPRLIDSDVQTLAEALAFRARQAPDALAFALGKERLSYSELLVDVERLAGGLRHRWIGPGDRVAILLPAGLDVVRLVFALQPLGAVPSIFDPSVPIATSARRIAQIGPRLVLIADAAHAAALAGEALESSPMGQVSMGASPLPPVVRDGEAIAFLQSTSGTSGEPRAAMTRQRNAMASLHAAREKIDPGANDVLVGWVPPWHDLG